MDTPGPVKAIICTVGETATSENMYPSDYCDYLFFTDVYAKGGLIHARKDYRSFIIFVQTAARRSNMEFGISFAFDLVTPNNLDESARFLNVLRREGIRHYGLLTVLNFQGDYNATVSSTRAIITGSHWFAVSAKTKFSNPSIITGLSFELSALKYVMVDDPTSLHESVFLPCLSVKKTGREALCRHSDFTGGPENYLDYPIYAYGVFSNTSKVLTLSEYNDSLATKFLNAVTDFGDLREDTAWLLYNVHNDAPNNQCPEPPFTVLQCFSVALKGGEAPAYH
ncbi:hypothetical protein HPB52_013673 [Rhipicephalus sanguineus]|uniref:Uncharacterized protein n=1 Tax=Rhipicephalus sanguineus TaxID=34632 RepID=A0A9D4PFJ4_RHISA|nr:hypothetical protein HPB52_013673 [Rhipicephalus sanguineus]